MELNLLAVVVELRPALSADHKESVIIKKKFSMRQRSEVLHHHQLFAVAYPQRVNALSGYKVFYLHFVRFLLSGCKIRQLYSNFAVLILQKCALLLIICLKIHQKDIILENSNI